jgi:Flp pilus assembly protein TadD
VREPEPPGPKEAAMERKVEEAWATAEADPSRAQQITSIVVKAVSVFPKNPRLRYFLARLHIQANRLDEAVHELTLALELDPADPIIAGELTKLRASIAAPQH